MLKYKSLSFKIISTSLIISLILIAVIMLKTQSDTSHLLAEKDKQITKKGIEAVTIQFEYNYRLMSLVLDQIVANENIIEAFASRDREKLAALTLPMHKKMMKDGIYQYHFHLPDNISLFRAHNPELYGDNLSETRPMLADANRLQKALEGLEEGVHGVSFRSIRPVYQDGEFIGSIELGIILDERTLNGFKSVNGGEWYLCALRDGVIKNIVGTAGGCGLVHSEERILQIKENETVYLENGFIQTQIMRLEDYSKDVNWFLSRVFDNTEMAYIRIQQRNSSMFWGFSLVAVGLVLMSLLMQKLLSPLTYLAGKTKLFTDGDFGETVMIAREDEIGQLALSMEKMRKAIHKKDAQLRFHSMHDQLTGLYNRTYFESELSKLEGSREYPLTIITADLDGLKLINDTMGHKQGDELIKSCARVLQKPLRKSDILARVGGDEFAIILPQTDEEAGNKIVSCIRSAVDNHNHDHGHPPLSVSLGVASSLGPEKSLDNCFNEADGIMYKDKLYRSASARGQIVGALLAALAERDYIAEGHADRLQYLCAKLARKVELPAQRFSELALLAQVHDLGKVGIPDNILNKEGLLTDEEWDIMRQHPEKGFRIARSSPDLTSVADLILRHHEKWDGTGYPLGLKGEEIPIECRILAIVDAYDAMTNDRPYSRAKSRDEAVAELEKCAGTQFDAELVEKFLQVLTEE